MTQSLKTALGIKFDGNIHCKVHSCNIMNIEREVNELFACDGRLMQIVSEHYWKTYLLGCCLGWMDRRKALYVYAKMVFFHIIQKWSIRIGGMSYLWDNRENIVTFWCRYSELWRSGTLAMYSDVLVLLQWTVTFWYCCSELWSCDDVRLFSWCPWEVCSIDVSLWSAGRLWRPCWRSPRAMCQSQWVTFVSVPASSFCCPCIS